MAWYCLARYGMVYGVVRRADIYMVLPGGHDGMVYGAVWRAWHGYLLWPGRAWPGICIGLAKCGIAYVIVWWGMAWYMVWPVGYDTVYRKAWRGMARCMVWPCGHGMVYGRAWWSLAWYMIWHGIWYGLARYGMIYDIAWRAWYCMEMYGMVWPGGHGMIRPGEVWHGIWKCLCEFHVYGIALGYGPVHMWRSRCQLEVLFTRTGPFHK